jgi:fructose-1,6-bisphosphatase/inositol monophosphatase family enzyme
VFYWRTLPWDHAPGVLLVEEAGAMVRRLDARPYEPTQRASGLLAAADAEIWHTTRKALLEGVPWSSSAATAGGSH